MTNHGIIRGPLAGNWLGGTIAWENRNPSGNWYPYLVQGEKQYFNTFDTMSCVSFAVNNVMEIQLKQQTGKEFNFSDRFLAKMSNTTQEGNWVSKVLDTWRQYGGVPESLWHIDNPANWNEYMAPIPQSVINQAQRFDTQYEYIADHSPATIKHELQHAPLLITIPGHEITGVVVDADDTHLTILDDYIFNVDPNPFVRKILINDITDIFKAVLTTMNNQTKVGLSKDGVTVYKLVPIATDFDNFKKQANVEGIEVPAVIPPLSSF